VAVNGQDHKYKNSIVKLQHPVQISSEAAFGKGGGSGAVWAALLLLLLIPGVVYFIYRSVAWVTFVTACSVKWQEIHSFACGIVNFLLPQQRHR
jgi:hypothetical protein